MDAAEALLARIVADPSDLDTRAVYADAVGGERGELIALEAELHHAGVHGLDELVFGAIAGDELVHRATQLRRLRKLRGDLLPAMRDELRDPSGGEILFLLGLELRHGFVGHAEVTLSTIDMFARLLERAPIESVRVVVNSADGIDALARLPLHGVREVELADFPAEASEMRALFSAMPRLRKLKFGWRPEATDIEALGDPAELVDLTIARPTTAAIAALRKRPIARQLARLSLSGLSDSHDPRNDPLEDPFAVFDGTFASAREISLRWLQVDETTLTRDRRLVFPPTVTLASLRLSHALARLSTRLASVRSLDLVGNDLDDGALAGIVQHATKLERLGIEGTELGRRGFRVLSRVQLRRLRLGRVADGEAALVAAHPLEELYVERPRTDVLQALADKPPTLRSLVLRTAPFDAAAARTIASAPGFAQLRRLRVVDCGPLVHGSDAVAALPSLVELALLGALARPTSALVDHPTLVELEAEPIRSAELQAAISARFGGPDVRRKQLFLFEPRELRSATVQRILEHFGRVEDRTDWFRLALPGTAINDIDADIAFLTSFADELRLASAIAEPALASRLAATTRAISIRTYATPIAALYPVARALQDNLGGTLWDAFEDRLTTI